jgi:hypothetical protein
MLEYVRGVGGVKRVVGKPQRPAQVVVVHLAVRGTWHQGELDIRPFSQENGTLLAPVFPALTPNMQIGSAIGCVVHLHIGLIKLVIMH